jgi:hypothetical protein
LTSAGIVTATKREICSLLNIFVNSAPFVALSKGGGRLNALAVVLPFVRCGELRVNSAKNLLFAGKSPEGLATL